LRKNYWKNHATHLEKRFKSPPRPPPGRAGEAGIRIVEVATEVPVRPVIPTEPAIENVENVEYVDYVVQQPATSRFLLLPTTLHWHPTLHMLYTLTLLLNSVIITLTSISSLSVSHP